MKVSELVKLLKTTVGTSTITASDTTRTNTPTKPGRIMIERHAKEVAAGTLNQILEDAGLEISPALRGTIKQGGCPMKYVYPATVSPEPNGGYSVWFEGLRGCATQGENLADALDAAEDALCGWLYSMQKDGETIPDPRMADAIPLRTGEFISYVVADLDAYKRFVESYSVRKNLTIPSWLAEKADAANINYSQVLQESLIARLDP